MKKLLLSLLLSSSMLHCSAAFAMNSDDPMSMSCDEERQTILPTRLIALPHVAFKAALSPSTNFLKRRATVGLHPVQTLELTSVEPEEEIVSGKTYFYISSSVENASEPISHDTYNLLSRFYADAYVDFTKIRGSGSPGKLKADLTVDDNTGQKHSINLFLSVITPQS